MSHGFHFIEAENPNNSYTHSNITLNSVFQLMHLQSTNTTQVHHLVVETGSNHLLLT
ncbi:hypothetical protein MTR_3g011430 [Medicago truncatula]|uniref:Uncharacterized protein n=1 Tax=Medicago truncatula TaxID=3880 RepID=A0A072V457_MEDTR|nr:hypothetical protein MTR_3g011430 [Medicago truncatula]